MDIHGRLTFMTRNKKACLIKQMDGGCTKALLSDADEVYRILWDGFDARVSHLPSRSATEEMIAAGEVSLIKEGDKILALAIFRKTGTVSKYLYQIYTLPQYRRKGLGKRLITEELVKDGADNVYSLWVEDWNKAAIELYEQTGFSSSDRHTIILKKENAK